MIRKRMLQVCVTLLFIAGVVDFMRGVAHTFRVRYAATHIAKIDPTADSLVLMGSFGISNFLTAFIYILIVFRARKLAPYILLLIPLSYALGILGLIGYQNVVLESEFNGQYMMQYYLIICAAAGLLYFITPQFKRSKGKSASQGMG
ncbi:hypothetical protein ABV409_14850 [Flagellimonas sp. DF-77]|uniref:hypothetical protein n=1 Tax=Flagellimonas algarum TaxID=3230298 RepID=UPI003394FA74